MTTVEKSAPAYVLRAVVCRYGLRTKNRQTIEAGAFDHDGYLTRHHFPLVQGHEGEPIGWSIAHDDGPIELVMDFLIPTEKARLLAGPAVQFSIGFRYDNNDIDSITRAWLEEVAIVEQGASHFTKILSFKATDASLDLPLANKPAQNIDGILKFLDGLRGA